MHFEAGYVPPHHSVASFAQAIRAIGEPIHNRTAEEISMAKLFTLLFEITGLFDMRTRPELLLLQKTMVVVEGVARSLDPKLDMWDVGRARGAGVDGATSRARREACTRRRKARSRSAASCPNVPDLLTRGAMLLERFDAITQKGLLLAPETVQAMGRAESTAELMECGGALGDSGALGMHAVVFSH